VPPRLLQLLILTLTVGAIVFMFLPLVREMLLMPVEPMGEF
jgi:hypothetical protein